MSSATAKPVLRSAAWRISFWAALAFTVATVIVFIFLDRFVAGDIQRRTNAWLTGEVETLGDVATHTPDDALYNRVVGEVAELASHEVPNHEESNDPSPLDKEDDAVFFLQTAKDGALRLWVGSGDAQSTLRAIAAGRSTLGRPASIPIPGFTIPFRVVSVAMADGSRVYLGLSERDERRVLHNLRIRFFGLWLSLVLFGFSLVFLTTRRTLRHVRDITEAASGIGLKDLKARVPAIRGHDEMAQLAHTLNRMLDRIENTVEQLHTITDSLAHDLRSPLTAIRGKLETSLADSPGQTLSEPIAAAIEELDRLTDFLEKSLDVAEAKADALRLKPSVIDLDQLLRSMVALYEPSMSEKDLSIRLESAGPLCIAGDEGLIHRMVANLFDNELKHLPPGSTVTMGLSQDDRRALLVVEDNGEGFDPEIRLRLFTRRVKGRHSMGHGLGLAFVDAVARSHGGTVTALNRAPHGARIEVMLPLASPSVAVHARL